MDFEASLTSSSVREQSAAALFLRAEGADGVGHLPALLQRCQAIDTTKDLDRFQELLLGFGAMTMGDIVGAIGFDDKNTLHISILQWIVQATSSPNINVAAHSIYGLGHLQSQHPDAIECLTVLVNSERRCNEHEHVSLRAIALRNLRRVNITIAAKFVDNPAFQEYAHALEHWLTTAGSKNDETQRELQDEFEWLTAIENRRIKP